MDVEKGVEVRPHHYIRFILSDGPVGINGRLKSGDELLEVGSVPCYNIRQFVILQRFNRIFQCFIVGLWDIPYTQYFHVDLIYLFLYYYILYNFQLETF